MAEPQRKSNLVYFRLKIWHLVAPILLIFVRINWPQCMHFSNCVFDNFSSGCRHPSTLCLWVHWHPRHPESRRLWCTAVITGAFEKRLQLCSVSFILPSQWLESVHIDKIVIKNNKMEFLYALNYRDILMSCRKKRILFKYPVRFQPTVSITIWCNVFVARVICT